MATIGDTPDPIPWYKSIMNEPGLSLNRWQVVGVAATLVVGYQSSEFLRGWLNRRKLECKRVTRQKQVAAAFNELQQELKDQESDSVERLTSKTLIELKQLLDQRQITVVELLRAYQVKALQSHALTNCLVEPITQALEDARSRDGYQGEERQGLLYGIPISVKEDVVVKGHCTSWGLSQCLDHLGEDSETIIKILREEGAVPFMRTNLPQTMMSGTSGNPIYGAVLNPHDRSRSPGGSSSGEAALIASAGSILGFGGDLAGSVRIPAHFCGICAFKPTASRCSQLGCASHTDVDVLLIPPVRGPMARNVDTVVMATRALWHRGAVNRLDPRAEPMPFCEQVYAGKRPLRIGYYTDNGTIQPLPVTSRAVNMARKHLEDAGHELVPWTLPRVEESNDLLLNTIFADEGATFKELMKNDEVDPAIQYVMRMIKTPYIFRWLYAKILQLYIPDYQNLWKYTLGKTTAGDILDLKSRIEKYRVEVGASWREHGLDAVICPVFPFPAPPLQADKLIFLAFPYTSTYNVLDYPAGVVRMTRVTSSDQDEMWSQYTRQDGIHQEVRQAMEGAGGMPVGVQVVGLHGDDEMVLRVMKEVEAACDY